MVRKMQYVVVKGKDVFVGLEDSKRTWKASVRCEKMEVAYTTMPAQHPVLLDYLRKRFPECRITVMYEAGFHGFWLYRKLVADGIACVVTPPSRVTHEVCRSVKTEKVDARRLARNLENGDYKACVVPDIERMEDRQYVRTLTGMQKEVVRVRNRIRKFLDFHGLGLDLPAGEWEEADYDEVRKLKEGLGGVLQECLDKEFELLEHLREIVKGLKQKLRELCGKPRYQRAVQLADSIPGIGWLTAIRIILEWGEDWRRFVSAKKLARFSGLTASEYSTGEDERRGRITGESRGIVRAWLIECAWTGIRKDPALMVKYRNVWHGSGSKKKAIVAVARKLVVRLRAVLIGGTPYRIGVAV